MIKLVITKYNMIFVRNNNTFTSLSCKLKTKNFAVMRILAPKQIPNQLLIL